MYAEHRAASEVIAWYEKHSDGYRDGLTADDVVQLGKLVRRVIGDWKDPVLDIGCGDGLIARLLGDTPGGPYLGIDPSESALERFSAHFPKYPTRNLSFRALLAGAGHSGCGSILALGGTASYLPPEEVGQITRMLKPGGRALLTAYADESPTGVNLPRHRATLDRLTRLPGARVNRWRGLLLVTMRRAQWN